MNLLTETLSDILLIILTIACVFYSMDYKLTAARKPRRTVGKLTGLFFWMLLNFKLVYCLYMHAVLVFKKYTMLLPELENQYGDQDSL
jgi:hypothetical protein